MFCNIAWPYAEFPFRQEQKIARLQHAIAINKMVGVERQGGVWNESLQDVIQVASFHAISTGDSYEMRQDLQGRTARHVWIKPGFPRMRCIKMLTCHFTPTQVLHCLLYKLLRDFARFEQLNDFTHGFVGCVWPISFAQVTCMISHFFKCAILLSRLPLMFADHSHGNRAARSASSLLEAGSLVVQAVRQFRTCDAFPV